VDRRTTALGAVLRGLARALPPERRDWAEAVQAEAAMLPAGQPRLNWLAGGLWLVTKEAHMVRKIVYVTGAVALAALAAWTVWLSWHTTPAAGPGPMTLRLRILAGAVPFVVLPWAGRRRGWFGPVSDSIVARLVRLGGCAACVRIGIEVVRFGGQYGAGLSPQFSLPREVGGLVAPGPPQNSRRRRTAACSPGPPESSGPRRSAAA
jgi:hypothetical protein